MAKKESPLHQLYVAALRARGDYLFNLYGINRITGESLVAIETRIDEALRTTPVDKAAAALASGRAVSHAS